MATGNTHKKFGEVGRVVFKLCKQTDTQTDNKQTYSSQYFATLLWRSDECNTVEQFVL